MASAAFKSVVSLFLDNAVLHDTPLTRRLNLTEYKNEDATVGNGGVYDIVALKSGSTPRVIVAEADGPLDFLVTDASAGTHVAFTLQGGGIFLVQNISNVVAGLSSEGHMLFHNTSGAAVNLSIFIGGD